MIFDNKKRGAAAILRLAALITLLAILLSGCKITEALPSADELESLMGGITLPTEWQPEESDEKSLPDVKAILSAVPKYTGKPYAEINNGKPYFTTADISETAFEHYSSLDLLGRCGAAFACVGKEIMPTEERGEIGMIKPTGWHLVKYDIVDGKYLYNRCHLLGYQLTGENANVCNLITGTRYMNIEGMLPFENKTADYIRRTGSHVLYRATPVFEGVNLLAKGVLLEGYSVEDGGKGICFNVFCYNVQPGIDINYLDGSSALAGSHAAAVNTYIYNRQSMKFHYPDCEYAQMMSDSKRGIFKGTRDELIDKGYSPCGACNP